MEVLQQKLASAKMEVAMLAGEKDELTHLTHKLTKQAAQIQQAQPGSHPKSKTLRSSCAQSHFVARFGRLQSRRRAVASSDEPIMEARSWRQDHGGRIMDAGSWMYIALTIADNVTAVGWVGPGEDGMLQDWSVWSGAGPCGEALGGEWRCGHGISI